MMMRRLTEEKTTVQEFEFGVYTVEPGERYEVTVLNGNNWDFPALPTLTQVLEACGLKTGAMRNIGQCGVICFAVKGAR